jgi:hypothetical protein
LLDERECSEPKKLDRFQLESPAWVPGWEERRTMKASRFGCPEGVHRSRRAERLVSAEQESAALLRRRNKAIVEMACRIERGDLKLTRRTSSCCASLQKVRYD